MDALQTLYCWYCADFQRHEELVERFEVRKVLGYEETDLVPKQMSIDEFASHLREPWQMPEDKQAWINRFVHGRRDEFELLPSELRMFLSDCRRDFPGIHGVTIEAGESNSTQSTNRPHISPGPVQSQQTSAECS